MDILDRDEGLTLAQAARMLPGKPSPSTVWRWCRQGVGGVKLEYRRLGRGIVTTRDAVRRFSDELTRRDQDAETYTPPSRRPTNAGGAADEIDAEAAAEGL